MYFLKVEHVFFALENDYVSIVPVQFDLTAYHAIQTLNNWSLKDVE